MFIHVTCHSAVSYVTHFKSALSFGEGQDNLPAESICWGSFSFDRFSTHKLDWNNADYSGAFQFEADISLGLRGGRCSLLKNWCCLVDFCDAEEDQWRIRPGLQAAVCVVDIDVGLSQSGCYPRDFKHKNCCGLAKDLKREKTRWELADRLRLPVKLF